MMRTAPPLSPPGVMVPLPARIRSVRREMPGTFTWSLEAPEGFHFAPGQFNMLYLFGVGEVPISISGPPVGPHLVHTLRAVGAVTTVMEGLTRGAYVGVRGPFGSAWPMEAARGRDLLIIAGGLGLAPLRPALYEALRQRGLYRRVALLYGARSEGDLLYRKELERWAGRSDLEVLVTVDRAGEGWSGRVGVVPALLREAHFDPGQVTALICGPEIMMRFTLRELERLGVADQDVFVSLERSMKCAVAVCGHCQIGGHLVCRDGPVVRADLARRLLAVREL